MVTYEETQANNCAKELQGCTDMKRPHINNMLYNLNIIKRLSGSDVVWIYCL